MITTILTILLVIIAVIAAGVFIMTFIPIGLSGKFSLIEAVWRGRIAVYLMHPRLVNLSYDVESGHATLNVVKWSRILFGEEESKDSAAELSKQAEKEAAPATAAVKASVGTVLTEKKQVRDASTGSNKVVAEGTEEIGPRPAAQEPPATGRSLTMKKIRETLRLLRDRRVLPKVLRWCGRAFRLSLRLLRFRHLRLFVKGGAEDPAETGKYYGWYRGLYNIVFFRKAWRNFDVRFEPDFSGRPTEVDGSIELRTSFARILAIVVIAAATFPYITLYRVYRRLKKIYATGLPQQSF